MEPKGESKNNVVSILPYGKTFLYIKNLENPHDKGIKNGYATMYDKNTLGWGTDVVSGPHKDLYKRAKAGKVTAKEARDLAVIDMRNHDKVIMENMKKYTSRPDTISLGPRLLMAQARYHYGNIINSFPEWGKAVATGDAKTQKKIALKLSKDYKDRYNRIKDIEIYPSKKNGGRFTFKRNKLVKNAEAQNKKDMRKKFVKSDYPTYTNNKKKYQEGGELDPNIFVSWNNIPTSNIDIPEETPVWIPEYSSYKPSFTNTQTTKEEEEKNTDFYRNISKNPINTTTPIQGSEEFNRLYDEVVKEDPEAEEYRNFLTAVAKYESNFNSKAKNKYAPAWGFFQFMQDNSKYNNIGQYAGVDTQTFLNNPKLQIKAAIKLAKAMEKGFSKEDWENAKSKGISKWGMLGGAWLGGNGGLRRYLQNNINISDKHWNPNNSGIDMISQIKRYNF